MWLCVHICVCVYLRVCVCVRGLPKLWVVGNSAQPWLMMTLREYGPKCSNFSGEAKHLYLYTFDISMSVPLKRKRNQNLVKVEHPGHCCQASAFNLYPCLPPSQSLESLTTFLCLFQPWTHLVWMSAWGPSSLLPVSPHLGHFQSLVVEVGGVLGNQGWPGSLCCLLVLASWPGVNLVVGSWGGGERDGGAGAVRKSQARRCPWGQEMKGWHWCTLSKY